MARSACKPGDYVLATKWHDGDPKDFWYVGFYSGFRNERHLVVDNEGKNSPGNGFRRVDKISARVGRQILKHAKFIELSGFSIWYWRRNIKKLESL